MINFLSLNQTKAVYYNKKTEYTCNLGTLILGSIVFVDDALWKKTDLVNSKGRDWIRFDNVQMESTFISFP